MAKSKKMPAFGGHAPFGKSKAKKKGRKPKMPKKGKGY